MRIQRSVLAVAIIFGLGLSISPLLASRTTAAAPCNKTVLEQGDSGACVGYIQNMLNNLTKANLSVDQAYGITTEAAVTQWQETQQQKNPAMLVDGVTGPQTWKTLCAQHARFPDTARKAGCATPEASCVDRIFSTRSSNDICVTYIQALLNLAANAHISTSYDYDVRTENAVMSWQEDKHIKIDGIVGPQTWKTFCDTHLIIPTFQYEYMINAQAAGCEA
jgi:peptidoglycan hydrolase-like protein with peptidoglycan-binding domain